MLFHHSIFYSTPVSSKGPLSFTFHTPSLEALLFLLACYMPCVCRHHPWICRLSTVLPLCALIIVLFYNLPSPGSEYYITLHHTTSQYITLHHTTSHCITLHHTTSHCITLHHTTSHYITLHRHGITCWVETEVCRLDTQNGRPRLLDSKFYIGRFCVEIFVPVGSLVITRHQSNSFKKCVIVERRKFFYQSLALQVRCYYTRPWVAESPKAVFVRWKQVQLGQWRGWGVRWIWKVAYVI